MIQTEEFLNNQIELAKDLIVEVGKMPDGKHSPFGIKYDESLIRTLSRKADDLEMEIEQLLAILYGKDSQEVNNLPSRGINRLFYLDFREDLKSELQRDISYLNALVKGENMKRQLNKSEDNGLSSKSPMIFISHSHDDEDFVTALVSLLESLGFNGTNLFCSSIPEYGIKLGQDIFEGLRKLFETHELFVIFIQSPRYFKSPVSLNEMGAAWVLKSDGCSFLTKDMEFEDMKGVVGQSVLSVKVNAKKAYAHMNLLKDKLTDMFGLKQPKETTWERKRDEFLNSVI